MTRRDFANQINAIQIAAGLVEQVDLAGLLAAIDAAASVAPAVVTDPAIYERGAARLADVRRLAAAASELRAEATRQRDAARTDVRVAG